MKILFYDVVQNSDSDKSLISPSLADKCFRNNIEINLKETSEINCFGLAGTNVKEFTITLIEESNAENEFKINFEENGLYYLNKTVKTKKIKIIHNGDYIGRFGAGRYSKLCTAMAKEPSLVSTHQSRKTLSGQIIPGAGGYTYWRLSLDTRYKIDKKIMDEIIKAYKTQIGKSFPFFISLEEEKKRLPIKRMYANDTSQSNFSFESSINFFLFSKKFTLEEAF